MVSVLEGGQHVSRSTRFLPWFLACVVITAPASPGRLQSEDPAIRSVLDWYKAFEGSAGIRAQYNGYVGERFDRVYALLSASLHTRMPNAVFEEAYAEVANMKLLQAHLVEAAQSAGTAEVFVEEERTIVGRTATNAQVPAVAWYTGTLRLERNAAGVWMIDSIGTTPEDIISMKYGGHSPWRSDAQEVAQVAAGAYRKRQCPVSTSPPASPNSSTIDWTVACADDGSRYVVHEVRLQSGEWHVLKVSRY